MPAQKRFRVVLDVLLTAMLVFEMFIQFTGDFLHEVVGFAFFATVVIHLLLSAKWMKSTARVAKSGKLTARRTALAVMGMLLAVTIIVLGVSSVAISGLLASAGFVWTLGSYSMWATVHSFSAYALCALVAVHLAMHWAFLASAFKVPYDPSRRRAISTGVHVAAAAGAVALGVLAVQKLGPSAASASTVDGDSSASSGSQENTFANPVDDAGSVSANGSAASSSDSASASAQSSASKGSTPSKKKSGGSSSSASSSASSSSSSANGSSASSQSAPSSGSESGQASSSSSGSGSAQGSSTASGICTLCRKQCPLSAPKCDKPYQAGLI